MTSQSDNAPELLRQEVLAEARRQKDDLLHQARQKAAAIVAKAEQEAEQHRRERLDTARAEANRRAEAILATVAVETNRLRSARVEQSLQAIHDRARQHLRTRSGLDYPETVARLSAEALNQMAGDSFRLRFSAANRNALGNGLIESIRSRVGRSSLVLELIADSTLKDGDVVLEDAARRQVWNLSLDARLTRCWPALRRQIADHPAFSQKGGS